jgi:hypothetical protein
MVDVAGLALQQRRRVERDGDHVQQFIDRDRAVTAAIARADDRGLRGPRRGGNQESDEEEQKHRACATHLSSITRPGK